MPKKIEIKLQIQGVKKGDDWPGYLESWMAEDIIAATKAVRAAYLAMIPAVRDSGDPIWRDRWWKLERSLDTAINGRRQRAPRGSRTAEDMREQNRQRQQRWRQRNRALREQLRAEADARRKAWEESPEGQAATAKNRDRLADMRASLRSRLSR